MSQRRGRVVQVGLLLGILATLGGFCHVAVSNPCTARPIQIHDNIFPAGWYNYTHEFPCAVVNCSDVGVPVRQRRYLYFHFTREEERMVIVRLGDQVHLTGNVWSAPVGATHSDYVWAEINEMHTDSKVFHEPSRMHNLEGRCIQVETSSGAFVQPAEAQPLSSFRTIAGSEQPEECENQVPGRVRWAFRHVVIVSPCILAWTREALLLGGSFMRVMVGVVRAHTSGLHSTSLRGCGWVTPEGSYMLLLMLPFLTVGSQGAEVLVFLRGWIEFGHSSNLIWLKNLIKGDFTLSILFSLVGVALLHGLAVSVALGVSQRLAVAMERKLSHQSQDRSNGLLASLYFSHAASPHFAACLSDLDGLWQCTGLQRAVQDDMFPFDVSDGSLSLLGSTRTFNELPAYMESLFVADIDVEVVFTQKVESLRARLRRKWILCIALPFSASVILFVWFCHIWQGAYAKRDYLAYGVYIAILGFTADAYYSKLPEKVMKLCQFGKEIPLEGKETCV